MWAFALVHMNGPLKRFGLPGLQPFRPVPINATDAIAFRTKGEEKSGLLAQTARVPL
jgi:hypothetical protein